MPSMIKLLKSKIPNTKEKGGILMLIVVIVTAVALVGGLLALSATIGFTDKFYSKAPVQAALEKDILTVKDSVIGTGVNQFNYIGAGWKHDSTNSYDKTLNDSVSFTYVGSIINYYGIKDALNGIAAVSIDGGPETYIDLYSPTRIASLLYSSPPLTPTTHTLKIRVTGIKNPASREEYINLDRVQVSNPLVTVDDSLINSTLNVFTYQGSGWLRCVNCGNGMYAAGNSWDVTPNDKASISFNTNRIDYYAVKDAHHGIAAVSIDGGAETFVDLYSPTRIENVKVWSSPTLTTGGIHTFTLRVTGTKNTLSKGVSVTLDRVDVTSPLLTIDDSLINSTLNVFTYQGSGWLRCVNCGAGLYGGGNSWDMTTNDKASISFNTNKIEYYAAKDAHHGIAAVSIDGGPETTVDLYAPTRTENIKVWSSPVVTAGNTHTFTIRVTGSKNPLSKGVSINLDRVNIFTESPTTSPTLPAGLLLTPTIKPTTVLPSATPIPTATPTSTPTPRAPKPITGKVWGINWSGPEYGTNSDYFATTAALSWYAKKGVKLIRMPMSWCRMQPGAEYSTLDQTYLTLYKNQINAAAGTDAKVIIDTHSYARHCGTLIGAGYSVDAYRDYMHQLAQAFVGNSNVWAIGLMNEPHDTNGAWVKGGGAQAGVNGVREVDKNVRILVPGDQWAGANAYGWFQDNKDLKITDPSNNFLIDAHQYWDNGTGTYKDASGGYHYCMSYWGTSNTKARELIKPFVDWLKTRGYKGIITEYGVPADNNSSGCSNGHPASEWIASLDDFYQYVNQTPELVGGTMWVGGGADGVAGPGSWIYNGFQGVAAFDDTRPQWSVLNKYPSSPL